MWGISVTGAAASLPFLRKSLRPLGTWKSPPGHILSLGVFHQFPCCRCCERDTICLSEENELTRNLLWPCQGSGNIKSGWSVCGGTQDISPNTVSQVLGSHTSMHPFISFRVLFWSPLCHFQGSHHVKENEKSLHVLTGFSTI